MSTTAFNLGRTARATMPTRAPIVGGSAARDGHATVVEIVGGRPPTLCRFIVYRDW
jgi:hypothetical protein